MEGTLKGSFQLMKSLNRSVILNKIRQDGPISRAELAKETKLTPPTVSNIVKELLEAEIIIESSQGESKGGRKPTMLILNSGHFYIIGLDVGPKYLRIVMTNLDGKIIETSKSLISLPVTNDTLLSLIKTEIQHIMTAQQDKKTQILGIGVGMHGVVNVEKGISLFAPSLGLHNVPIKQALEEEFGIVVQVENDARAMALGEYWFGNGFGEKSVVAVNIGRGIGSGIVINGELFRGDNYIAGEIGHMAIELGGTKCSCGNYGCLQTVAAGPAITARITKELSLGRESVLREMVQDDFTKITGELVYKAALSGDRLSLEVLNQTGRYLGIGLTNLIHILNPQRIIIGGGLSNASEFILDHIKKTIHDRALTAQAKATEVLLSKLGEHATCIGAVSLILVEFFSSTKFE